MTVAIDYGKKRCGYAYGELGVAGSGVVSPKEVVKILEELHPSKVVVGLPLSMSGRYSCQTFEAISFADSLKEYFEVFLMDERLSTKMAHEILKSTRGNTPVDAVSASLILENFIENPEAAWKVPRKVPKVSLRKVKGGKVLVYNLPDPEVLDYVKAEKLDVLQRDPYIAYLFKKRVRFVERLEEFLEGNYDLIVTCDDNVPRELLAPRGRVVKLEVLG